MVRRIESLGLHVRTMFDHLSGAEYIYLSCYVAAFSFFAYSTFLWVRRNVTLPQEAIFRVALACMAVAVLVSIGMGNLLQAGMGAAFAAFYYGQR